VSVICLSVCVSVSVVRVLMKVSAVWFSHLSVIFHCHFISRSVCSLHWQRLDVKALCKSVNFTARRLVVDIVVVIVMVLVVALVTVLVLTASNSSSCCWDIFLILVVVAVVAVVVDVCDLQTTTGLPTLFFWHH